MGTATRQGIMLACQADAKNLSNLGRRVFLQPKLNGERCRTVWQDGPQPILLSSYCNSYENIQHINDEVARLNKEYFKLTGFKDLPLDGELYRHGMTWSQIRSIASRSVNEHSESAALQYHIFDLRLTDMPQHERFDLLNALFKDFSSDVIVQVKTLDIDSKEVFVHCESICANGYEGVIVRDHHAVYVPERTRTLLKYKPTEEDTYKIVDIREALEGGTRKGKGMVGAFYVCSDDNVKFKVSAGRMNHKERIRIWAIRQQVFESGQLLLVRHEKLRTINGVPLGCVGLSLVDATYEEKAK